MGDDSEECRVALARRLFSSSTMRPGSTSTRGGLGGRSINTLCRWLPDRTVVRLEVHHYCFSIC